jgi:uncharacterized protein
MLPSVTERLADDLEDIRSKKLIVWHGGEPLSCGLSHFEKLLTPLVRPTLKNKINHGIQTNCTLITDDWCDLFKKHNFKVGISIDGPNFFNKNRVDWNGKEAYKSIIKGIEYLKKHNINFSAM